MSADRSDLSACPPPAGSASRGALHFDGGLLHRRCRGSRRDRNRYSRATEFEQKATKRTKSSSSPFPSFASLPSVQRIGVWGWVCLRLRCAGFNAPIIWSSWMRLWPCDFQGIQSFGPRNTQNTRNTRNLNSRPCIPCVPWATFSWIQLGV